MSAVHLSNQTLLLSRSYEPVKVISWQRAITLLTIGKAEVVEEYEGHELHSASTTCRVPAVVRLLRTFKRARRPVKFSRSNIYARDKFTCQYCGERKRPAQLSYDHVVPRAQGGKTVWTNIVTACEPCNLRKGGRTPEQAGMTLLSRPEQPRWVPSVIVRMSVKNPPAPWRDYMHWASSLDEAA